MNNNEDLNLEQESQNEQQMNPLQMLFMKMEMLESYITQINTYMSELSKVNNNGWETYEAWSKRISQEMKVNPSVEKRDFSVKRASGIIM